MNADPSIIGKATCKILSTSHPILEKSYRYYTKLWLIYLWVIHKLYKLWSLYEQQDIVSILKSQLYQI